MISITNGIHHFKNSNSGPLSEILHGNMGIGKAKFWELLKLGAIYVNDERFGKDKIIAPHSLIRVHSDPHRFNCDYKWGELIVFENDFFLVLNKPAGVPSHPVVDNAVENALTQTSLAQKYPLFVTHRLDTLTSGLIVYGKKASFVKHFNQQLLQRKVQKKYVALVEGTKTLPTRLIHYMDPAPGSPKKLSLEPQPDWSRCELEILEQKKVSVDVSSLKINLLTGRTHQIRAQLSFFEAPILGDTRYGAKTLYHKNSIALRSYEMEFEFQGEAMKFQISDQF